MNVRALAIHDTTGSQPRHGPTRRRLDAPLATAASVAFMLASLGAVPRAAIGGELLVSGFFSDRIERYDDASDTHLGSLDVTAGLDGPLCARLGPDGLLYVASEGTDSVVRFDPFTGLKVDTFITAGAGGLDAPTGLTWDPTGRLYVSAFNSDSILRYNTDGSLDSVFIASGSGGLNGPDNGSTFGPDGHLYVPSY
jgi:streptogramin lyase